MESGGVCGDAAAAAQATTQRDVMSDLIYRDGVPVPASWEKTPSSDAVWTDTPTLKAVALASDSALYNVK